MRLYKHFPIVICKSYKKSERGGILNTDKTNELRLALSTLPVTGPDIDLFYKLCPHLNESQIQEIICGEENAYTIFAIPNPEDASMVLILNFLSGGSSDEEDVEISKDDDDYSDDDYDPPIISCMDRLDITKNDSYFSIEFGLNAFFVKEAIDWQLANK